MKTVIFDLESDGLLDAITTVHCLQIGDAEGDDAVIYSDKWPGARPISEGLQRLREADRIVGLNIVGYDYPVMEMFFPGVISRAKVWDCLVMARLMNPEERSNSLSAWGQRLGVLKGEFKGPWDVMTQEMVDYAIQDVSVTRATYQHIEPRVRDWGASIQLEHDTAWWMFQQERNGFSIDVAAAEALAADFRGQLHELTTELQAVFPPITRSITRIAGASNKNKGRVKGQPYVQTSVEEFNPASRRQIAERLTALGWKPKAKGADGTPTVDETVLSAMKHPAAKVLLRYFRTAKMLGQLADGKAGWLRLVKPTGRIHGRVNPNGACTGRMSHSGPNVAQVDKDKRMRSLWKPRPGWKLVGCDAEGLEARMLGHYLARYDEGAFSDRVVNGKKEDGTDVHTTNLQAVKPLGLCSRDGAKTLLYALIYGAGDAKLGWTVKVDCRNHGAPPPRMPNMELGAAVRGALARSMKGMDKLTAEIKARAKSRGYLIGLDGRRLFIRSQHSALNTLLQGGGAIVMKKALCLFMDEMGLNALDHGGDFGLCANVHDEVQIEARPDLADGIGKRFAANITLAGVVLNVKCPLAGAYDVGESWAETH